MATEYPPLNKIYVFGYSANDRDFPILSATADPRVAGYQVPKDLSACPDKRYPNHVFTGAQPIAGDQRVRHVWEILPSPWVPFTRYDDDLGPIQGRRRSVKNEGQVASLTADKRITYEAREGSAIVYTELEETWSIKTDEDGNSLFPIRDRDFYDPSRGPVQERRQLFVPTGEEEGSLENVNGVITQTSYEPYNEFLSVKIVQTYKVNGPQLIGNATDNDGQLVTVTTQRKGAKDYVAPNPTATRTVEVSREDAESLVERIVDTPQVFGAEVYRKTREDITPQKFKAAQEDTTTEQNVAGTASPSISLSTGEFAKSEQQINKFVKRISTTSRDIQSSVVLSESVLNQDGQIGTRTLTLASGSQTFIPSATLVDASVEALGDGRTIKSETVVPEVFDAKVYSAERPDPVPQKFRVLVPTTTEQTTLAGQAEPPSLEDEEISKTETQQTKFVKRVATVSRNQANLPKNLTQKTTTPEKQVAVVTETLRVGDFSESPTATTNIESEALGDGTYLVRKTQVDKVFENKIYRKTKDDLTPQKFRAKQEEFTEEQTLEGTADPDIVLDEGEFSKSEQQVNEFVKRVSTTSRVSSGNVDTITEKVLTNNGQLATRTLTLSTGTQSFEPRARLIDANVESLGDGRTVKTEVVVPSVFANKAIRATKTDLTPQKFQAVKPETTTEESIEGTIDQEIELAEDEFSKSEQQVTNFVKRVTSTKRDVVTTSSIEEQVLTNNGQLATRTLTLSKEQQTLQPDALIVDGNIEALGDGRTIKTEVKVDNVFDGKTITAEIPDLIPVKFRTNKSEITEETISELDEAIPNPPELEEGEYRKTEQKITEFTKRTVINKKNDDAFDELDAASYDESFGLKIPFIEKITDSVPSSITADVESLGNGKYLVRDYDMDALEQELENFSVEYPTRVSLSLPNVLKSITVDWDRETQVGSYENDNSLSGDFRSISLDDRGSVNATLAATPKFNLDIEEVWGRNLVAKTSIFFLKGPISESDILTKTGSSSWPVFKPKSYTITAIGKKVVASANSSVSAAKQLTDDTSGTINSESSQIEKSVSTTPIVVNIPPCLTSGFSISSNANVPTIIINAVASINVIAPVSRTTSAALSIDASVNATISPTSPPDIPRSGVYLIDSSVEFFKFGWFIVKATTFDAGQLA